MENKTKPADGCINPMRMLFAAISLLLLSGISAACTSSTPCSYGEYGCGSNAHCVSPLVCDDGWCNQPSGVCSIMPRAYEPPPPVPATGVAPGSPAQSIGELEGGSGVIGGSSGIFAVGWFSDWTTAGLIGVAIAFSIIALAAIMGHSFNLPEVKAFANAELGQAAISVLLIVALIGMVEFFDAISREAVLAGDLPITCTASDPQPCYISAAKLYLDTLYEVGSKYAREQLSESIRNQAAASFGVSSQMNFWQLLYAGGTIRMNAGLSIPAERAGAIFDTVSKLLASIYAQKYFIDVVSFGIAPIFLLLGIVLRTFFFTRKLGGLLLAIAISLFIIYPLTYVFAWYTLNVTIYGERTFAASDPYCPRECTVRYPVAFYVDDNNGGLVQFEATQELIQAGITDLNWDQGGPDNDLDGTPDFPGLFACRDLSQAGITKGPAVAVAGTGTLDRRLDLEPGAVLTDSGMNWAVDELKGLQVEISGMPTLGTRTYSIESNTANTIIIRSSSIRVEGNYPYEVKTTSCGGCPDYCREVPFPSQLPGCDIAKCSSCNAGCKIMRQRDCRLDCPSGTCSNECRTESPVENSCFFADEDTLGVNVAPADLSISCGGCSVCPNWCKFLKKGANGQLELVYKDEAACSQCNTAFQNSLQNPQVQPYCPQQCMYISDGGSSFNCNSLCTDPATGVTCPAYCRLKNLDDPSWVGRFDVLPPSLSQQCGDPQVAAACAICPASWCKTEAPPAPQDSWPLTCAPYPEVNYKASYCQDCPQYCRFDDYSFITSYSYVNTSGPPSGTPAVCATGVDGRLDCSSSGSTPACSASCKPVQGPLTCRDYDGTAGEPSDYCRQCPGDARITLQFTSSLPGGGSYSGPPKLAADYSCDDAECALGCRRVLVLPNENDNSACGGEAATGCPIGCRVSGIDAYLDPACTAACAALPQACKVNAGGGNTGYTCSEYLGYGLNDPTSVAIDARAPPYNDRTACRQCPEQCRISNGGGSYYEGSCGVLENDGNRFVDCSILNCPSTCRVEVRTDPPPPSPSTLCQEFIPNSLPCTSCPAACRTVPSQRAPGCPVAECGPPDPSGVGCTDECRIDAAPAQACSGCLECDLDCTYYPAVRTDCSEICTDEALAGPVNIAPDDFIKKLPGATGALDVRNVGILMVPALVLPLFSLVMVIAFIRILSPILGGDVEIPGLGRII